MDHHTAAAEGALSFWKMNGSGNDFILLDNRTGTFPDTGRGILVRRLCHRQTGIGADGLILIENDGELDFRWQFHNADGSLAEMCGNGGRCAARFAFLNRIAGPVMVFGTLAGPIRAVMDGDRVKLQLTAPVGLEKDIRLELDGASLRGGFVNTGVPHVAVEVDDLDAFPVVDTGRRIRYHECFRPAGTNANFYQVVDAETVRIRTYERGVEDETLACGTGSVAVALIAAGLGKVTSPTRVVTRSGEVLGVFHRRDGAGFAEVFLEGDAKIVYKGTVFKEFFDAAGQ